MTNVKVLSNKSNESQSLESNKLKEESKKVEEQNDNNNNKEVEVEEEDDDEEDPWDQRIRSTGCYDENMRLHECYMAKHDWRACKEEMEAFKQCFARRPSTN